MPALVIANSPGGVPDTPGDWAEMERLSAFDPLIGVSAVKNIIPLQLLLSDNTPLWAYCPVHENFSHAPDTWVYYAEETLAGNHLAYERRYAECGVAERLHLSIQPGMMHAYACLPVFKESKHAYAEQLAFLNAL